MFIASAPIVLNIGQFPQKMPRPRRETTAKTTANDRHMSVGRTIPRKLRNESKNPTAASVHTTYANSAGNLGKSHERAGGE